jgi:pimeloyl-ACP methyl ester carboxylesterase
MKVDMVGHSIGGFIARRYVEGNDYAGGVGHLILVGTPNRGTRWASLRIGLEMVEHYQLWRHDPNWSATWMITDGLGEAGDDLQPHSAFLTALNARPRRAGVKYTIIAGDQSVVAPMTARALDGTANVLPNCVASWWGFRQTESVLHCAAERVRTHVAKSDGPVSVSSTRLAGVADYVVVHADHNALYLAENGNPPAAWEVIRDRLTR